MEVFSQFGKLFLQFHLLFKVSFEVCDLSCQRLLFTIEVTFVEDFELGVDENFWVQRR